MGATRDISSSRSKPRHLTTLLALAAMLCVASSIAAQDAPEAEVVTHIKASSADLGEIKTTASDLRSVARSEARDRARSAPPLTPAEVLAKTGKKDPARIFEWVRDSITFEPYVGALRSPHAVLAARSANAVDAARLLHTLYASAGMNVRYVKGELDAENATALLARFTGAVMIERRGAPVHHESFDQFPERVRDAVGQQHVWVEVEHEGRFKDADPFTGLTFETTRGKRLAISGDPPEHLSTQLEIVLVARQKSDGRELELIKRAGSIDEFSFRTLGVSFTSEARVVDGFRPILHVGGKPQRGKEYFSAADLSSLELRFDLKVGRQHQIWKQPLYQSGKGDNPFAYEQLELSMTILPGWTSDAQLARVGARALGDTMNDVLDWAKKSRASSGPSSAASFERETRSLIASSSRVFPYVFARHLDRVTFRLAESLGVKPVLYRPRIFVTSTVRDRDTIMIQTDLQGSRIEAVAALGVPEVAATAFGVLYGRMEDELEGALLSSLTATPPTTTTALFERAVRARVPVWTLHPGNVATARKLKKPEGLGAMLAKYVKRSGAVILVPSRPVELAGKPQTSWWEVDPVTGSLQSVRWEGLFNIAGEPASKAPVDQGKVMLALTELSSRQLSLWMTALAGSGGLEHTLCSASDDARTIGRALCATKSAKKLPKIAACVMPTYAEKVATPVEVDPLDPMGIGGGGAKLEAPGCDEIVAPMRCGAVTANAFLYGDLIAVPRLSEEELVGWKPFLCDGPKTEPVK